MVVLILNRLNCGSLKGIGLSLVGLLWWPSYILINSFVFLQVLLVVCFGRGMRKIRPFYSYILLKSNLDVFVRLSLDEFISLFESEKLFVLYLNSLSEHIFCLKAKYVLFGKAIFHIIGYLNSAPRDSLLENYSVDSSSHCV